MLADLLNAASGLLCSFRQSEDRAARRRLRVDAIRNGMQAAS
jgi:hypothetical protein